MLPPRGTDFDSRFVFYFRKIFKLLSTLVEDEKDHLGM